MTNVLSGDPVPHLAWMAQTEKNEWKVDSEGGYEIKKFLIDPASLKTGWNKWENQNPNWTWSEVAGQTMAPPEPFVDGGNNWRQAYGVSTFIKKAHGAPIDGWRDWFTDQACSKLALKDLWNSVSAEQEAHKGKCAIVEVNSVEAVHSKSGKTNYRPVLKLVGWKEKPEGQEEKVKPAPVEEVYDDEF
jgi:hypothetical protein